MSFIGFFFLLLSVVVIAALVVRGSKTKRLAAGGDWRSAIEAATRSLGGRPALSGGEAEFRAEHEGFTVTAKIRGGDAVGEASLYPGARQTRIYLGWGAARPPEDISNIPEASLPPAFGLDSPVALRTDDPDAGVAFAEASVLDLSRIRDTVKAEAVEVLIRGGAIRLTLRRAAPSPDAVDAIVRTTSKLAGRLGGDRAQAEAAVKQIPAAARGPESCAFCSGERLHGVPWVRCLRCGAAHHAECWEVSKRCTVDGCGGLESQPI